jgi:hypothetical protein
MTLTTETSVKSVLRYFSMAIKREPPVHPSALSDEQGSDQRQGAAYADKATHESPAAGTARQAQKPLSPAVITSIAGRYRAETRAKTM